MAPLPRLRTAPPTEIAPPEGSAPIPPFQRYFRPFASLSSSRPFSKCLVACLGKRAMAGVVHVAPRRCGSFGGDVALPSVAGGVTAADCKTGSAASGGGSRGNDVTLPVTAADCRTGSAAAGSGSRGDDVTLPVTGADCKTGSAAAGGGSRGDDVTLPVTVADCKTGSAATGGGSRGDDVTLPVTPDCKTGSAAAGGSSRGDNVTLPVIWTRRVKMPKVIRSTYGRTATCYREKPSTMGGVI
jgi:hypothetical protein